MEKAGFREVREPLRFQRLENAMSLLEKVTPSFKREIGHLDPHHLATGAGDADPRARVLAEDTGPWKADEDEFGAGLGFAALPRYLVEA